MGNKSFFKKIVNLFLLFVVLCCGLFYYYKVENKKSSYNMNLSETISMANIYKSANIDNNDKDKLSWEASNDNVTIKDNVVIANKVGTSHLIAKDKDNKVIYDVTINVLEDNNLSLDSHSVNLKLQQSKKIVVNNSSKSVSLADNDNNEVIAELSKIYSSLEINESDIFSDGSSKLDSVKYVDINEEEEKYEFESSDESVAIVDDEGNIDTISAGEAIVTVTDNNGNEDFVHVVVDDENVDLYTKEYNLAINDIVQLEYRLNSMTYSNSDIIFSSDNNSIATVSNTGEVRAVSSGSTNISLSIGDKVLGKVLINVMENTILPNALDISTQNVDMRVGDVNVVNAVVYPYSANNRVVTWSSENSAIAIVDNGVVRAVGVGETIISATSSNGIRREIKVVVDSKLKEAEDINFSEHFINMNVDDVKKVNYDISPSDAVDKNARFYYDENYVNVSEDGIVKALKAGNTVITIFTNNKMMDTMVINITDNNNGNNAISLNNSDIEMNIGDVDKLIATGKNLDEEELIWSSSNSDIVKVDENGNIEAINSGNVIISVALKNNSSVVANCHVTVKKKVVDVSEIKLNYSDVSLYVGDSKVLIPSFDVDGEVDEELVWSSNDTKVAEVDNKGNVKAIGVGTTVIKVELKRDSNIYAECRISVNAKDIIVNKLAINKESFNMTVGDNDKLSVLVEPANATNNKVNWSSSNEKVIVVDNNGNVKAVGVGTATIKVELDSNNELFATSRVSVKAKQISVNNIKLNKSSLKLKVGEKEQLSATVSPSNANNKEIVWMSDNTNIAIVNSKTGKVKGIKAGTTTVKAISKSNSSIIAKCTVTVVKESNKEKFINNLDYMSKQVKKDGNWHYGGKRYGTFAKARKNKRTIDCALYVSYALVDTGVINSKSRFYKKKSNSIAYSGSAKSGMKKHLKYISGGGKKASTLIKKGKLQKGDIVLWYNQKHTNVYAGGKKWYDGGRWSATGAKDGHKFKTLGPVSISSLNNNWKVWQILRFKD